MPRGPLQPRRSASGRPALQAAGLLVLHGRPYEPARLLVTGRMPAEVQREQTQTYAAWLHYYRGDAVVVQAQADALLPPATAQGFPLFVGLGTC